MAENTWMEKMVSEVLANLANKSHDLTFTLDKFELKTPWFEEPLKLSGKLTIELSSKKSKK